jgi:hypothetical protein
VSRLFWLFSLSETYEDVGVLFVALSETYEDVGVQFVEGGDYGFQEDC